MGNHLLAAMAAGLHLGQLDSGIRPAFTAALLGMLSFWMCHTINSFISEE